MLSHPIVGEALTFRSDSKKNLTVVSALTLSLVCLFIITFFYGMRNYDSLEMYETKNLYRVLELSDSSIGDSLRTLEDLYDNIEQKLTSFYQVRHELL